MERVDVFQVLLVLVLGSLGLALVLTHTDSGLLDTLITGLCTLGGVHIGRVMK